MLKNILLIITTLLLLVTPILAQEIDFGSTLLAHSCYSQYPADQEYNFVKRSSQDQESKEKNIILDNMIDICRYSSSPSKCQECILFKKYNIEEKTEETKTNSITYILALIIVMLIITITYLILKKWKKKN